MLKLDEIALELLEYKLEDLRTHRSHKAGTASAWDLCRHLQRQSAQLDPEQRRRLEQADRTLRRLPGATTRSSAPVTDFDMLVLDGGEVVEQVGREDWASEQPTPARALAGPGPTPEHSLLQALAAKVWRHDLERFVRRIAGGLRAERDRYTARLLFAVHRNLQHHVSSGGSDIATFAVVEPIPDLDDALFSANDLESLVDLVQATIDCIMALGRDNGEYRSLGVKPAGELGALREIAQKVASEPYAGRLSLLGQRGPTAQQLRVAIQELGKERMRDEERLSQRRQLEDRLQGVLALERNQRQLFRQDVAHFVELMDAFFQRLAHYLPRSLGGEAGPPQLAGGVLFAANPALRVESVEPHVSAVTVRLKGATRLKLAGLELSLTPAPNGLKLFVRGEEHRLEEKLSLPEGRKWLHAFREGEYVHLKVEDEGRSSAVRVAEAAAVLEVVASPRKQELLSVMRMLTNSSIADPQELVRSAIDSLATLTARVPDRVAALHGFLRGSALAARVEVDEATLHAIVESFRRAMMAGSTDLATLLEEVELGEVSVHTLTGEPLAVSAGGYSLTVRRYATAGAGGQESLVVMLPGHALGTFEEYLIESLGDGTLVCVRGEQELVVGYLRSDAQSGSAGGTSTAAGLTNR